MSRFLRLANDDSDSSSSDSKSEDEDGSDDDDDAPKEAKTKIKSAFLRDSDEEESDEEVKRVVKSARDKRLEEMEATGKTMDNALKINDWIAISTEYDKLARMVQRQQNVAEPIPPFYIRTLISLETGLNAALAKEKEAKKKMNAANARALTAMKQKVRKTLKEFEKEVKQYNDDPEAFEQEFAAFAAPQDPLVWTTTTTTDDDFTHVGRGGRATQYTSEGIYKHLQAIHEARGKKNTDRSDQIRTLERLIEVAVTPYQQIRVLLALVSSRFDYNATVASYMPIEMWLSAQREIDSLIAILIDNGSYSVQEITEEYDDLIERTPEGEKDGVVRIRGSIISFVDRLDDEFARSLQNLDPHGTEYVDRLKDEKGLYCTICRAETLYEKKQLPEPIARVIMRRLEHIYSKPDAVLTALESAVATAEIPVVLSLASQPSPSKLIHTLCVHLYKSGNSVLRTRAMLSHIYHHALHNDFYTARDMLLMSHLQETVYSMDVGTQIQYNRAVVQLGLCAFRSGLIKEAQSTLQDIFATQRVKELLAQGVHQPRFQTLTPEQEKAEKQRQLPFHMHINTELLEAAFLVSSIIDLEEQKRKAISKPFRRLLDFAGSTRDHIMQASKALQHGQWEQCRDLIQDIKIWSLMPEATSVKEMLAKRIQEEGLRTYLFAFAPHYKTLSLALLERTFSLDRRAVNSIVSRMIWTEELPASLDQSAGVIVFHRIEPTRPQQLAQILAEKVGAMVEQNEKALDIRLGGASSWGDRADGLKGDKRGEQTQERRGRGERRGGGARGGTRGGRGARFAQGLGNQMTKAR
ncbi:eukaryotic translation initiation factor 3 subunit 8 [Lactarius hengduanensis]|nr:eukaryotic translation initiation factor 3 subunit 8 [Lactarius hengduanensis]